MDEYIDDILPIFEDDILSFDETFFDNKMFVDLLDSVLNTDIPLKTSGVYIIFNKTSGQFYIGTSKCIQTEKKKIFVKLQQGMHYHIKLQKMYNESDKSAWDMYIIETTNDLFRQRLRWIKEFNNQCTSTDTTRGNNSKQLTQALKSNITETRINTCLKSKIKKTDILNKKIKLKIKKCMIPRPVMIGTTVFPNIKEAAKASGRHRETITRWCESNDSRYVNYKFVKPMENNNELNKRQGKSVVIGNITFSNIKEAAKACGYNRDTIKRWCESSDPKHNAYKFVNQSKAKSNGEKSVIIGDTVYPSIMDASKACGYHRKTISNWCKSSDLRYKACKFVS